MDYLKLIGITGSFAIILIMLLVLSLYRVIKGKGKTKDLSQDE
jgi:hypothetical protein